MARFQRGSLRKEERASGATWVLRFYANRETDGKRVERTVAVALVDDIPSESGAWAEVERQRLHERMNKTEFRGKITFGDLAAHYMLHELGAQGEAVDPKSPTTIENYKRNLRLRILPKWGKRIASSIRPLEIEVWLKSLQRTNRLKNTTIDKHRRIMSLIYKSAQRYGLILRNEEGNPLRFVRCKTTTDYEAVIVTPQQAHAIFLQLAQPESTLVLVASSCGLRISECLGLRWHDIDFKSGLITVRRTWTGGRVGLPKSRASQAAVPLHPMLAKHLGAWHGETPYASPTDWVFPSIKLKGRQPRVGNMLVEDHLRPAAIRAGVLKEGQRIRFGFHTLRHSLASFLVGAGTDPKTVQTLLRHSDVSTTLQIYAHSHNADRLLAQGRLLDAFFMPEAVP
jgi:integrase